MISVSDKIECLFFLLVRVKKKRNNYTNKVTKMEQKLKKIVILNRKVYGGEKQGQAVSYDNE